MKFDIVIVTYNSEKWIENCISSIVNSNYDTNSLSIIIVDNKSEIESQSFLELIRETYHTKFNTFSILKMDKNYGFGKACNIGFSHGNSEYAFFLNVDTEIDREAFTNLEKDIINSGDEVAAWELRQFPYEHPKIYNPITRYVSWSSGAALIVKRDIFRLVEGFDEKIFMYAEDVDLSWRLRCQGYKLRYVPEAIVVHHCYKTAHEVKPSQYINSLANNLILRYKFGTILDIIYGYLLLLPRILKKGPFEHSRKLLFKSSLNLHYSILPACLKWNARNRKYIKKINPKFLSWDYEISRRGAFYYNNLPLQKPLVSILIRTCGRPSVLRETLISVRNQTYKNIEVVIVEDGMNLAQQMIEDEFTDLKTVYKYTGDKVGRCIVGNMALELSGGEYLNFLDDDDVLYPEHIEVLVSQILNNRAKAAYSIAHETPIIVFNKDPYQYEIKGQKVVFAQPFSKMLLFVNNFLPIQTVMFSKDLYEEYGGFDPSLEVLEDWDLWCRYALNNDFVFIDKITSQYRVPFIKKEFLQRRKKLLEYTEVIRGRYLNKLNEKNKKFPDFETEIKYNIEYVGNVKELTGSFISVSGWAFIGGSDNKRQNTYIILTSSQDKYVYKAMTIIRDDVINSFNISAENCGFNALINKKDVHSQKYKVAIYIEGDKANAYYTTDYQLEI